MYFIMKRRRYLMKRNDSDDDLVLDFDMDRPKVIKDYHTFENKNLN